MPDNRLGFAVCGSFCTHKAIKQQFKELKSQGFDITPILSEIVYSTDTRFAAANDLISKVEEICGNKIIHDIPSAEPIGPKNLLDVIVVSPCTGNTAAKIALGITDTPVTMAVKAHLRNNKPVVLALATNDALGASAKNIGYLQNTKNIYFVPYRQDDPFGKNNSLVCDFSMLIPTIEHAIDGKQIQPQIIS